MILLGMLIVVAAVIIGVGVVSMPDNRQSTNTLELFGYGFDLTLAGVFLAGAALGALALLGLAMVLGRASGIASRKRAARHELRESKREAKRARKERDRLLEEQSRRSETTAAPAAAAPAYTPTPQEPVRPDAARQEPPVEYPTMSSPPQGQQYQPGTPQGPGAPDVRGDTAFNQRRQHSGFWGRLFGHRSEKAERR